MRNPPTQAGGTRGLFGIEIKDQRCARRLFLRAFSVLVAILATGVLGVGLWRWRLHREVRGRLQAIREAGLPTSGAELNQWYRAVPDNENAAVTMAQAFALLRTYPDDRSNKVFRIQLPARGGKLDSELLELLAGFVQLNAPALSKAREAVALSRCRYPVDCSQLPDPRLDHLSHLERVSYLAEMEGLLAIHYGRPAEALDSTILILKMARTLDEEPIVISQNVRLAMIRIALRNLERALTPTDLELEPLIRISKALALVERTNHFRRAWIGERAISLSLIQEMTTEVGPEAKKELPPFLRKLMDGALGPDFDPGPPYFLTTGTADRMALQLLVDLEARIQDAGLPWPERLSASSRSGQTREALTVAQLRVARAAVAVEQFRATNRRLASDLRELVPKFLTSIPDDPVDGRPIRFKRLKQGFIVYSIGLDQKDDGGKERPNLWPNGTLFPESKREGRFPVRVAGSKPVVIPPLDITFTVQR